MKEKNKERGGGGRRGEREGDGTEREKGEGEGEGRRGVTEHSSYPGHVLYTSLASVTLRCPFVSRQDALSFYVIYFPPFLHLEEV